MEPFILTNGRLYNGVIKAVDVSENVVVNKELRTLLYGTNNWRKMHGLPMLRRYGNKF